MVQAPPRQPGTDRPVRPGLTTVKIAMLITDIGFLAYWSAALLGLIPAEYAYKDYDDPVMSDWNYSFLPLDVAASATGLASLHLCRRERRDGPSRRIAWRPLMLVSLTLTSTAGLQAVVFWALRGDWSPTWWIPNLALLLFPVPAIARLLRHEGPEAPVR
ncbi:DUF5360 family protein [Streptomyces flavofungini]|uniref:DUF5360 family protein n=1 Tax=Streptomyces flavofungini TaxID=68200 RepID=A0ABS0WZE8_9ACTN|nr:DUF5360 family protein [Streptomyces flavofungini]MBJ3806270.1 DUF5360 family protein [Streptomyces flavofungini]GHC46242.1 hypothetical protein GCM10010349_08940 [Streptomyces flavofungini]